jgi:hypothetical protein
MSEPRWIKASLSAGIGACVELALIDGLIAIRHSRRPENHILYSREEIAAFFDGVRSEEFDHLLAD